MKNRKNEDESPATLGFDCVPTINPSERIKIKYDLYLHENETIIICVTSKNIMLKSKWNGLPKIISFVSSSIRDTVGAHKTKP